MLIYLNRKKEVKNLLKVGVGAWLNARKVMQHYIRSWTQQTNFVVDYFLCRSSTSQSCFNPKNKSH